MQKNSRVLLISVIVVTLFNSCTTLKTTSNKDKGVATGAATGAVIGGVIGNNVGNKKNTALGAILGAVIGGVAGGVIGDKMDKQAEKIKTEIPGAKVERVGEGINVVFNEKNPDGSAGGVYFKTGKYNISPNSQIAISKLKKIFAEYPETNILIEGHTDNVGSVSSNQILSERRANAVAQALISAGVSASRFMTKGYGETQPMVENTSDANKALNRRVQFAITANEKMKKEASAQAQKN